MFLFCQGSSGGAVDEEKDGSDSDLDREVGPSKKKAYLCEGNDFDIDVTSKCFRTL